MSPSLSAMTWATWASVPGSLMAGHLDAGREALALALVDVPAHVEPALGLVVEVLQGRRLDRIDGDPLARRHDADDALAGHRAALGEADRHVAVEAADRDSVILGSPSVAATGRGRGTSRRGRA